MTGFDELGYAKNLELLRMKLDLEGIRLYDYDGAQFERSGEIARCWAQTPDDIEDFLVVDIGEKFVSIYTRTPSQIQVPWDDIPSQYALKEYIEQGEYSEIRREKNYWFPKPFEFTPMPELAVLGDTDKEFDVCAVNIDDEQVAAAWSVRRNDKAAEVAVETKEGFRRRGYGKMVVMAWVNGRLREGKVPLYTHRTGNLESQALAESLGAVKYSSIVSYY